MKNIDYFLKAQKQAMCNEFENHMCDCLIATTPEKLEMHSQLCGWELQTLPGTKRNSVLVIRKRKDAFPELWARWNYTNYRKAFGIYLKKIHGLDSCSIPFEFQVDHLEAKSRFRSDYPTYFIRLYLLNRKINASYGAGYEKIFNKIEQERSPSGGFHMSWVAFLKAYEVLLPSKTLSESIWKSWADVTARRLTNEKIGKYDINYFGILGVLRLGYTGSYAGFSGEEYRFPITKISAKSQSRISHSVQERATDENIQYEFRCVDGVGLVTFKSAKFGAEIFNLPPRRDLVHNYPGDFSWGHFGAGPYFLTVSILAHHLGQNKLSLKHINIVLTQFISKIPFDSASGSLFFTSSQISSLLQNE